MEQFLNYARHIEADEFIQAWVKTTLKKHLEKNPVSTEEVEHILDYLVQSGKKVSKMSYASAKKLADDWMKTQQKKGNGIIEKPEDTELVIDFKDGFKIVKLLGKNAYKREGFLMSHCVASYYGKDVEIFSLRDKDNMPHCTMEKDQQIKGKGNGDIHPKYVDYVVKFLEHVGMTVGDSEMKHLGYINIEKLLPELSDDVKKLCYQGKYYPQQKGYENLKDKEGNQYLGMDILDYFPMFKEEEIDTSFKLKLNFDMSLIAEYHKKIVKKITDKFFKSKDTIKAGNNANVSAEDNAKVSAEDNAKVSAGYNANVSAEDYANVSAGSESKISAHKHSILVADRNGQAKGKIGTLIVLITRESKNGEWIIIDYKAGLVDGKKIKEDVWYKLEKGEFIEVKN